MKILCSQSLIDEDKNEFLEKLKKEAKKNA